MNKKGFAISTMLYGLSIMGFLIVILLMSIMANNRYNTKEIVSTIEEELNRYTRTNTTFNSSGTFVVPTGERGFYKLELWGKDRYKAITIFLQNNTTLDFTFASNEITVKVPADLNNPSGATPTFVTTTNNTFPTTNFTQVTNEFDASNNKITVTISASNYKNQQVITNLSNSARAIVRKITSETSLTYPSTASAINASNFYIIHKSENNNQALTVRSDTKVDFETFTGNKNQQWNIRKVGSNYRIVNSTSGNALEVATETMNNLSTVGDVEAKQKLDNNSIYMHWTIAGNVSDATIRSDKTTGYLIKNSSAATTTEESTNGKFNLVNMD